ncbi:MAG TPA: ABC transporter substrate-binding protein, partial [Alphaproteobacteria bacterium]|nr:ABC transporter substrate-binding protein [Alphaproteobacteria bacterium]
MTRRIVMLVALLLAVLLPPAAGRAGAASVGAGRQVQEPHGARRVVSLNLCTDQLAVRLAAPGQLLSVSNWALKPASSMVVNEVRGLVINHGQAEEILPLKPDLVLVGDFTNRATVGLLRRLGRDVQEFGTPQDFDGIVAQVRRMAGLLGREAEGERMVAA